MDFESYSGVAADMKPQLEQMILDCDEDSMMNSITSTSTEKTRSPSALPTTDVQKLER